jgi:hypothetical protein
VARVGDSTAAAARPTAASGPTKRGVIDRERPRHLRVVRPTVRRRRAGLVAVLLCLVFFSAAIGVVAFQAQLAENQLLIDRIEREYRAELRVYDENRAELARLESPSYVLAMADALGLRRANPTYLAPSPSVVSEVVVAMGPRDDRPTDAGVRPDWATVKPIVGAAP